MKRKRKRMIYCKKLPKVGEKVGIWHGGPKPGTGGEPRPPDGAWQNYYGDMANKLIAKGTVERLDQRLVTLLVTKSGQEGRRIGETMLWHWDANIRTIKWVEVP